MTLALIDYGAGNLQSVKNALKAAGAADVVVTGDPDMVARADRIVLPGVGAFAHCMGSLSDIDGMIGALSARVLDGGVPFVGICVGMQVLADAGVEHGTTAGLGWIGGTVRLARRILCSKAARPISCTAIILMQRCPSMFWQRRTTAAR